MKASIHKILLYFLILMLVYFGVLRLYEDHLIATFSIFLYIIIWIFVVSFIKKIRTKKLRALLNSVGEACSPNDMSSYRSGFIVYQDCVSTGSAVCTGEGIKLYHLNVGNILIRWGKIKLITKVRQDKNNLLSLIFYADKGKQEEILIPDLDTKNAPQEILGNGPRFS